MKMQTCREISALISQGLDKKLSFAERLAIYLHLLICSPCRNFRKHSLFIRKAAQHYVDQLQNKPKQKL
jgi:hypothetical protein